MEKDELRVLILSAGKIDNELAKIFGDIPSGLIPLNGKPVIFRIIDKLIEEGFKKISITVGYKKEILEQIVKEQYKNQCDLEFISTDFKKPPGNSIKTAINYCNEEKLLIILGDTLIENNLIDLVNKGKNFVITSQEFSNIKNWCVVTKKENKIDEIFDKEDLVNNEKYHALVGCYFINNQNLLKNVLSDFSDNEKLEISSIIEKIKGKEEFQLEFAEKWHDVGHLENYYSTKQFVLKTRYFNKLQFDQLGENVIKTSTNKEKLIDEITWYDEIPEDVLELVPKKIDSSTQDKAFIKLEYVKYPTLSELWLYSEFPLDFWKKIIGELFGIIQRFKKYNLNVTKQEYRSMYFEKTLNRINQVISKDTVFREIFEQDFIFINNKKLKNWNLIKNKIKEKIDMMYNENDNCLIHGDLYFANILYNSEKNIFKLIDPRGVWGNTIGGDIKYDIAKIRHSVVGCFDTITNGLYSIKYEDKNKIQFNVFKPKNYETVCDELDTYIGKKWNLDEIKMIEGLLFISMLPLHEDNVERQLAFFCIGLQRLNEIFGDD
ncbi:sugar phosphate nucleotidyltransferase [Candidatus Nitrosopelagicus sp.]|nr:sugar phosphate nucleotidyltransferase [Candidatus Nitrosopelagicus sp.]